MTVDSAVTINPNQQEHFLNEVVDVEKSAWPPELQAPREKFASRLKLFPEGFFVVRVDGKIKGVTTSQITTYDETSARTWDEITDNGMIERTHNPSGNALYVVSVGVAGDTQGMGVGGKLVESQIELAKKLSLKYLFLGARAPGYDDYCRKHGGTVKEVILRIENYSTTIVKNKLKYE